jgi:outer membrane protein assembly factor BamD (BamD/ComL family)
MTPRHENKVPFAKGQVIVWCDEFMVVQPASEDSGVVRYLDGSLASNNFRWVFEGEAALLATAEEMADLSQRWPHLTQGSTHSH